MIAIQKIGKSFSGALNYNLKKVNHPNPQKRAELLDSNFSSLDPGLIQREVEILRSLKPNLNRYVYHTSLNFSDEDALDNVQMLGIAREYLEQSGYANNQYLIFRHYDAQHPHIHLLVNRISFEGKIVSDSNNYKKSEAILRKLEAKYNLVAVEPSNGAAVKAVTKSEIEMMDRTGKPSDKLLLQELMNRLMSGKSMDMDALICKAEQAGISFLFNQASTGRVSGITYFYQGLKIKDNHSELLKEITKINEKLFRARELLLKGDIDPADYRAIKSETEPKLEVLEIRLAETMSTKKPTENISQLVSSAMGKLSQLDKIYLNACTEIKRELIGSIFPQKFTFEELQHRTAKISDLYSFIYLINSEIEKKKRRASDGFSCLPTMAPEAGLEPATL